MFELEKMNNDDTIWVKMKKEISGESKDIFIGTRILIHLKPKVLIRKYPDSPKIS